MSAWLLAALLCTSASAQVFETGGAASSVAPVPGSIGAVMGAGASVSPIASVPGASLLAPALNTGAVIKAFSGEPAANSNLPAGAARFAPAPLPALPAAAATNASAAVEAPRHDAAPRKSPAPASRELTPPGAVSGRSGVRTVAADRRHPSDAEVSPEGVATRLDAADEELAAPLDEAGGLDKLSAEGSAALGRKIFDRSADRALLADGSAAGSPGAPALAFAASGAPSSERRDPLLAASYGGTAEDEALRDAVASPIPAAAAPAARFSFFRPPLSFFTAPRSAVVPPPAAGSFSFPITFERLSLELGSGLVVKVRAALGFAPIATVDGQAKVRTEASVSTRRRPRVPITSTEWLERRGLLESISASEAAASQEAALPPSPPASFEGAAPAPRLASAPSAPSAVVPAWGLDPAAPARVPALAWWSLAFLPAGLVLLKERL